MRIAQVSPLYESVPPQTYGGTERVVSFLTEELVERGHDVTLFASGDSTTKARLVPKCPRALRSDRSCVDPLPLHLLMIDQILDDAESYDLIHFHVDYLHFARCSRVRTSALTTLHGRLDIPDIAPYFRSYRRLPFVSISNSQRLPMPWLNWCSTVYHGLPRELYKVVEKPGSYLAFLGRISPEKGVDRAIEIARRTGIPLKIAAKVDKVDVAYFETKIKPLLNCSLVEYIGEIGEGEKGEFLGNAMGILFLIDWPEPFGLVMIEAMACGTPLVAYCCGSVPEVVDDGITGFVVNSMDEALEATRRLPTLNRSVIRKVFERRFSVERMLDDYIGVYSRLIQRDFSYERERVSTESGGTEPIFHPFGV